MWFHRFSQALLFAAVTPFCAGSALGSAQIRADSDSTRDVLQTIQARKMLADEPELAHMNIGVHVRSRVATLWGPVPTAEASFRAELCLRTMIEIIEVRNELIVSEPLEIAPPRRRLISPPRLEPNQVPPPLPREPRTLLGPPGVLMGHDTTRQKPPVQIKVVPGENTTVPMLGSPELDKPIEKLPATQADSDLGEAVQHILQSKPGYRQVQYAVQDGRIYLRSSNPELEALHEAAREIARLPNVDGVIILEKATPR